MPHTGCELPVLSRVPGVQKKVNFTRPHNLNGLVKIICPTQMTKMFSLKLPMVLFRV